jgi:hypothetical protein
MRMGRKFPQFAIFLIYMVFLWSVAIENLFTVIIMGDYHYIKNAPSTFALGQVVFHALLGVAMLGIFFDISLMVKRSIVK